MKITGKLLIAILLVIFTVASLASCEGLFGRDDESDPSGDMVISRIVYADEDLDFLALRSAVSEVIGGSIRIADATTESIDGEIVLGDTGRAVTAAAKSALDAAIAKSSYDCGYIIFCDGKSVAVYWQLADMAELAMADFIDVCVDKERLKLDEGDIVVELFDKNSFLSEGKWLQIEAKYGKEMLSAMRTLYNFFEGDKIVDWLANLYDPEIGGFYYSRSARDYSGFFPDLESTQQTFGILSNLGAIPSSMKNAMVPAEIKEKLVTFAREMQSDRDGYFYHPQWAQDKSQLQTDRYGRDQGNAMAIISAFTYDDDGDGIEDIQYPKYCTIEGDKCEEHASGDGYCSFAGISSYIGEHVTSSGVSIALSSSVSSAVSRLTSSVSTVTPTVSSHPDYSSASAFSKWLEEYNSGIKVNSGNAHNLAAISEEIMRYGYIDILMDHLDKKQAELFEEQLEDGETPSGIWQRELNYRAVWGVYKYLHIYNLAGVNRAIDIKYVPYMVESCLAVILRPANKDYAYNDLMNQWTALGQIITNVKKHYGQEEVDKIYERIRQNPVELVQRTIEKMQPFKMKDGSICVKVTGDTPSTIYGVDIALGVPEGTVNSTHILLNIYGSICSSLGCNKIALCDTSDGERFVETISTIEPVYKEQLSKDCYNFDNGQIPGAVQLDKYNTGAYMEIAEMPDTGSDALHFYHPGSDTSFDSVIISTSGGGNDCAIFDAQMYIDSESSATGGLLQIFIGKVYTLQIERNGNDIEIYEVTSINNDRKRLISKVNVDESFGIRVEYYSNINSEEYDTPAIKLWVNEEYVMTSDSFYGSHTAGASVPTNYNTVEIRAFRARTTHLYIDEITAEKSNASYDAYDTEYPAD